MVIASAAAVEGDEAVVLAGVLVVRRLRFRMSTLVDEVEDAGCRLSHVRVVMLEVLVSFVYRLEMLSPCQAERPIRPRPDCVCVTVRIGLLVV